MDPALYKHFLGSIKYSNETKAKYYDVGEDAIRYGWLSDAEVQSFIVSMALSENETPPAREAIEPSFKILIFSGMGTEYHPLQTFETTLTQVMEACGFPSSFVQTIDGNNGQFAHFIEYFEDKPTYLSVVLKFPYSPIPSLACTLRTRLVDRATSCLIFAQRSPPSSGNLDHIHRILDRLHARRCHWHKSPLQLISTLAEEYGRSTEEWRAKLDYDLVQREQRLGKTDFNVDPLKRAPSVVRPYRVRVRLRLEDLEDINQDLHTVKTHLIWLDCATNFELELNKFGNYMVSLCEDLREMRRDAMLPISYRTDLEAASRYHFNECTFKRYQCTGLQRRAETQINLLYSEISQRDSRVNLSVAEDSRRISSAALIDSRAMRTIAVVTLLFLPPSLIASIYDAGIIDVGAKSIQVSKYWWTYFTSSVGLTSIVFAVWILYMRLAKGPSPRLVSESDVEKGK